MTSYLPTEPVALDQLETFADGLDHAEGIAFAPDGYLYLGGEGGQVYRIVDDEPLEIFNTGGFHLGVAADGANRLYICDTIAKCVWQLELETGRRKRFFDGLPRRVVQLPNWGCFDGRGNYYLTDSGGWMREDGLIWVVRPGGQAEIFTEESTAFPNGCAISADGSRLFVAESVPGAIVEIPIDDRGQAGPRRVLLQIPNAVPDGIALTEDGALVISCYRPDVIYRWHPREGLDIIAADPRGTILASPTNVVFAGKDRSQLVVPNLGRWHLCRGRFGMTGVPLHYPDRDVLGY